MVCHWQAAERLGAADFASVLACIMVVCQWQAAELLGVTDGRCAAVVSAAQLVVMVERKMDLWNGFVFTLVSADLYYKTLLSWPVIILLLWLVDDRYVWHAWL